MALEGKTVILEGMPKLAVEDLSVEAVVKWRAAVTGWFKSQGLEEYTIYRQVCRIRSQQSKSGQGFGTSLQESNRSN